LRQPNRVAGERHESKLVQAIEHYTDIRVLGAVRRSKELIIDERHLGLMPANELTQSQQFINSAGKIIADQVDLDKILSLGGGKKSLNTSVSVIAAKRIDKPCASGFCVESPISSAARLVIIIIVYFS
jgi:cobyrinic acid a,c-diamide synthase